MNRTKSDHGFAGIRIESAMRHIDAMKVAEKIVGPRQRNRENDAFFDYLCGWDEAMKQRVPELLEENTELHNRLVMLDVDGPATVAEINALREVASTAEMIAESGEYGEFERTALAIALEGLGKSKCEATP